MQKQQKTDGIDENSFWKMKIDISVNNCIIGQRYLKKDLELSFVICVILR